MNKKVFVIFIQIFIVSVIVIGFTYSFYVPRTIDNQIVSTTNISNKNIMINYIDGSDILIDSSNTSVTKNIEIRNNNISTIDYILNFSDVVNTLVEKSNLKYSYTCSGVGCDSRNELIVPDIDSELSLLVSIGSFITHTYTITFTYEGVPSGSFVSIIDSIKPSILISSTGIEDTRFFWGYRDDISSITFEEGIDIPIGALVSWDVSEDQDGGIIASIVDDGLGTNTFELFIQMFNKRLFANPNSSNLFISFVNLTTINNLDYLNTNNVINMSSMFGWCTKLASLDLSNFDTSKVTDMNTIFAHCYVLPTIDVSNFDTSNVTNMSAMFWKCYLIPNLNLSSFNTSSVTDMSFMFNGCNSLSSLDLSTFTTTSVTTMTYMFNNCNNLINLNLSNFDTINVVNMDLMFNGCIGLSNLELRNANFTFVTTYINMFSGISNGITIVVRDVPAQTFINNRLTDAGRTGNVIIY